MKSGELTEKDVLRRRFAEKAEREEVSGVGAAHPAIGLLDAVRLFDKWADRQDLANNILYQGCHARAHLLCREMESQGYETKKAWAIRDANAESFITLGHNGAPEKMNGEYHVAPAMPVVFPDGRVEDLIFDTTLADGPMTEKEWRGALGLCPEGDIHKYDMVPFGKSPLNYNGDYHPNAKEYTTPSTDEKARIELDVLRDANTQDMRVGSIILQRNVYATTARKAAREEDPEIPVTGRTWFAGDVITGAATVQQDTKPNLQQWLGAKFSGLFK